MVINGDFAVHRNGPLLPLQQYGSLDFGLTEYPPINL